MDKVKLTKAQATALERTRNNYSTGDALLKAHADPTNQWQAVLTPLNEIDLMTMAKALIVGYEVIEEPLKLTIELSPEVIKDIRKEAIQARGVKWTIQRLGLTDQVLGE